MGPHTCDAEITGRSGAQHVSAGLTKLRQTQTFIIRHQSRCTSKSISFTISLRPASIRLLSLITIDTTVWRSEFAPCSVSHTLDCAETPLVPTRAWVCGDTRCLQGHGESTSFLGSIHISLLNQYGAAMYGVEAGLGSSCSTHAHMQLLQDPPRSAADSADLLTESLTSIICLISRLSTVLHIPQHAVC